MPKYPQPGDVYESLLYHGQVCKVVAVQQARVTFQWLGEYQRIEPQVVPVNRFIADFTQRTATTDRAASSPPVHSR
jgi:Domain of unknown function (DUF4222)